MRRFTLCLLVIVSIGLAVAAIAYPRPKPCMVAVEPHFMRLVIPEGVETVCGIAFSEQGINREAHLDAWERAGTPPLPYPFTITMTDTRPGAGGFRMEYRVRNRADLLALDGADFWYRGAHYYPVRFEEQR